MAHEIYIDPATGAPVVDESGEFVMTEGPETSLYLAIVTALDSMFGAPTVGSRFPTMITGSPLADQPAALQAATALALGPLEAQGVIDVERVVIDGHQIIIEVRQLAAPFVVEVA